MVGKASGRVSFSYVTGDLSSISQNVSPSRTPIFLTTITSKQATRAFPLEKACLWKTLWTGWLPQVHCSRPCTTGVRERGRKNRAHAREKVGEPFPCVPLAFSRVPVCPFPLPVKTPYVYFLYLSKMSIILPVFLLVCPFFGNVIILFISHFHFAQKTLSRKSLGTHSSLEESFTGLIDWKAAKLDSGQNCNELNWIN